MQAVKYWIGYQFLKNLENAFSHVMCLSGCLTLYRLEALIAVDHQLELRTFLGDEVKYGEDRYLTRKLVESGRKTRLCFNARCFTKAPATIAHYLNQQLRWRRSISSISFRRSQISTSSTRSCWCIIFRWPCCCCSIHCSW